MIFLDRFFGALIGFIAGLFYTALFLALCTFLLGMTALLFIGRLAWTLLKNVGAAALLLLVSIITCSPQAIVTTLPLMLFNAAREILQFTWVAVKTTAGFLFAATMVLTLPFICFYAGIKAGIKQALMTPFNSRPRPEPGQAPEENVQNQDALNAMNQVHHLINQHVPNPILAHKKRDLIEKINALPYLHYGPRLDETALTLCAHCQGIMLPQRY